MVKAMYTVLCSTSVLFEMSEHDLVLSLWNEIGGYDGYSEMCLDTDNAGLKLDLMQEPRSRCTMTTLQNNTNEYPQMARRNIRSALRP